MVDGLWGEPQWAVVGDTFPLGGAFSDKVVYHEFFAENPDAQRPDFASPTGIYAPGCGFDHVVLSWGHDEYIATVCRDYLPAEALFALRYHSLLPVAPRGRLPRAGECRRPPPSAHPARVQPLRPLHQDRRASRPRALRPYYEDLIAEFFPATLRW